MLRGVPHFFIASLSPQIRWWRNWWPRKVYFNGRTWITVRSLNRGKSPGLVSLPPEFYVVFWDQVGPLILDSINVAIKQGSFHRDQRNALITLLFKKGKDPLECSSYRPISLICRDIKMFSKVLATRIEKNSYILIKQGFLKEGWHQKIWEGSYILLTFLMLTKKIVLYFHSMPKRLLSAYGYLWMVLEKFGYGQKFISTLNVLYGAITASVLTGTFQASAFNLNRGTRQGCPCSPLLFVLSLEPLAQAIRESEVISPITVDQSRHYLSLYADDCLLFFSNIQESLPHRLALFNNFHNLTGYKINWSKSALLPLNQAAKKASLPAGIPVCSSFTYLGIEIYPNLHRIVYESFHGVKKKIASDLQRWGSLQVSMQGRVSTIKMNVLPRINFLFFMIPLDPL